MRHLKWLDNSNVESLIILLYLISVLMISSDIFFVFNIFGFSVRLSLILLLFPMLLAFLKVIAKRELVFPLGIKPLLIWTCFILLFIPHTTFLIRNIGYAIWLCFYVVLIITTVQLFRTEKRIRTLLFTYVLSFLVVSIFGILQFIIGLIGLNAPLVVQWWPNGIPRVNGFSYEPSYYATFLITGWVFVSYLFEKKSTLLGKRLITLTFILSTIALILSSSRMGYIVMFLWLIRYPIKYLLSLKKMGYTIKEAKTLLLVIGSFISVVIIVYFTVDFRNFRFLIEGLGIGGASAHSSSTRITFMMHTLQTFIESPVIGYSLGGIAPAIGQLFGVIVTEQTLANQYEGMNITAEVLAGSGIFGFIFFLSFLWFMLIKPIKLSKKIKFAPYKHGLVGLVYSFLFLLLILQFNQNILRPYLWLHIAIIAAFYQFCKNTINNHQRE